MLVNALSGMFEPLAGITGCWLATEAAFILPYALAFAAGAMVFVVVDDVIPETQVIITISLQTCGR